MQSSSSSSTSSTQSAAAKCKYNCENGPFLLELCSQCENNRSNPSTPHESDCQVCSMPKGETDTVANTFQTRIPLPVPTPHLRAMISVVLQDLDRSMYAIPYIPTALVELITEYATTALHEAPVHAVVCSIPDGLESYREPISGADLLKAEFHSSRDLRAQFIRAREQDTLDRFAIAYFMLHGEEMQHLRKKYKISMPPEDYDLSKSSAFWKYFGANHVSSSVVQQAANRMRELLFSIHQTAPQQRTPFQQDIWNQCGKWGSGKVRDLMLQELSRRTQNLLAPLSECLPLWLSCHSNDSLYSLTEYIPQSGELLVTSCMSSMDEENRLKWMEWKYSNAFWQQYAAHTPHTTFQVPHRPPESRVDAASEYANVEPPPF